jgi:hypothetical protein
MPTTHRAQFRIIVKENTDGEPYLMFEPADDGDLPPLGKGGFIGLDLKPGTALHHARGLAQNMNQWITGVSITTLP